MARTPLEINGQLHVDPVTGQLMNEQNYPIQLRGMSSHGLQWYPEMMNETSIRALQEDWGADVVRLSTYIQEGGYEEHPAYYLRLVDGLIETVTNQGMYVLIDFHQLDPGDPYENIDHATTFFTHMANTHKDKNNIFYEICNEPNGKTATWPRIKQYADSIIPLIRAIDDKNIIIVGTPTWAQDVDDVIGNRVDDQNTMYTVHFYATDHTEYVRQNVRRAIEAKIPIFVTECGTQEASGDGRNDFYQSELWFDMLKEHKISWCNWNFSSDERSGAAFIESPDSYDDYEFYTNDDNLKEAGLWIKNRMRTEDDFGDTDPDKEYNVIVSNGTGTAKYKAGASVTITADAAPEGFVFDKWVGDIENVTGTFDSIATFTMVNQELQFTAFYKDPSADIDTASLSENFVLLANWVPNLDQYGSAIEIDSSLSKSDTITSFTITKADGSYIWAQARGRVNGKYDAVNVIKISYKADKPCQIVLDNPNLDSDGASHIYDLPATAGDFSTLFINIDDFYQPDWIPGHLEGAPRMEQVNSISIAAVESGVTTFTLSELRLNKFAHEQEAILKSNKKELFSYILHQNRIELHNVQGDNLKLRLFTVQGREVMRSVAKIESGTASLALPLGLAQGTYVLQVQNRSLSLQKIIRY